MGIRGKPVHIYADLSYDILRGSAANPGDGLKEHQLFVKRAYTFLDFLVKFSDLLVHKFDMLELCRKKYLLMIADQAD